MKRRCNVYIIWIVVLLFIQQLISGCATTVTKDLHKEDLYRQDVKVEEVDPDGQNLFKNKCSICHELPDVNAYSYTPEQWSSIIDIMHDTKAAKKFMTIGNTEKVKDYLRWLSQAK
ncbi:MAG: hypothetical protein GY775_08965 [Candidatus Scalindua sp.]|nr:hypothetical protein [Candidatus Scalindua sp.]